MRPRFLFSALLSIAIIPALIPIAGQAEVYKWKDAQGNTVISDTPQPGAGRNAEVIPSASPAFPGAPAAEKRAAPSVADQELEFRKRQQERQEAAKKAEQEKIEAARKAEGCERAQRNLKTLESGGRITMANEKGEQEYLNDQRRQEELARTRQSVQEWCN
jgi:hypothetical protein